MSWFRHTRLDAPLVRSLAWRGDELVDWLRGGETWRLDGSHVPGGPAWSEVTEGRHYDAVTTDTSGRWAAVFEKQGTQGELLLDGERIRSITRDDYHADAYAFPVALINRGARVLLAHCPARYDTLQLDDALTGRRLTESPDRTPRDVFHSRLAASPSGRWLLSAGWVWQPFDVVEWFDVDEALRTPRHLDAGSSLEPWNAEGSSAAWLDDATLLIGGGGSEADAWDEDADPERSILPMGVVAVDIASQRVTGRATLPGPAGRMMAAGPRHVVAFHGHPKLVSLDRGAVVHEWPELDSGRAVSSIALTSVPDPPIAMQPSRRRFAVASKEHVDVIEVLAEPP